MWTSTRPNFSIPWMRSSTPRPICLSWHQWRRKCSNPIAESITFRIMRPITRVRKYGIGSKKIENGLRYTICPLTAQNSMLQSLCGSIPEKKARIINALNRKRKSKKLYMMSLGQFRRSLTIFEATSSLFNDHYVPELMRICI